MLDPHREIQALVDSFVADLSELAKRVAIEQLKIAFGAGVKLAPRSALKLPPPAPPAPRANRPRRRQHEIEALRDKLLAAIAAHPGLRAEDINAALGTKTAQIAQPLRRLVADRMVRTEGARRGMRYFTATPADVQNGRRPSEPAAAVEEAPAPA